MHQPLREEGFYELSLDVRLIVIDLRIWLTRMKTDFTLILPILALMLSALVSAQPSELRCILDPNSHDSESS